MKKISLFFSFIIFSFCFTPTILAGGSSYSYDYLGKTSFVKSGAVLPNAQRIFFETYFNEEYFGINQIRIDKINVFCNGDDIIQNAKVRIGSQSYGLTSFQKFTYEFPDNNSFSSNTYVAEIKPLNMILENDSYYLLSIDVGIKTGITSTRAAVCHSAIADVSLLSNGKKLNEYEIGNMSAIGEMAPSVIISGRLPIQLATNKHYYDNKEPVSGYMRGNFKKSFTSGYTLSVGNKNWDDTAFYNVMLKYYNNQNVTFDVKNGGIFNSYVDKFSTFKVLKMNLYDKPAFNGSVGAVYLMQ